MIRQYLTINTFLLSLILLFSIFTRFITLDWGAPYFFHPDERNIASAISQLSFPDNLNPQFFAYGALPIYIAYLLGVLQNAFRSLTGIPFSLHVSFEQAILILRIISALFSTLIVVLLYRLGQNIHTKVAGLLAAFLGATSIGLIQYAHFGTFELWLSLLSLLLFATHLALWKTQQKRYLLLLSLTFGLLVATKISSLMLFPLFVLHPVLTNNKSLLAKFRTLSSALLTIGLVTLFIFLLTNPFSLLDFHSFYSSISYESGVATGKLLVFYTGEFMSTRPILYPLLAVYPFFLNPLVYFLLLPLLALGIIQGINHKNKQLLLLFAYLLVLFLSQTFLFVKWARYFIPTLPALYLLMGIVLSRLPSLHPILGHRLFKAISLSLLITLSLLFAGSFVKTVYLSPDTRVQAARWAQNNITAETPILSEVYDLGIVPFNEKFPRITLFNFYDLDNNSPEFTKGTLDQALDSHQVLVLPSQRIVKSRVLHHKTFPLGASFYSGLFAENTQFRRIYTTPCDLWCNLTYWGDPIFAFEGTTSVFDRPTIFIFTSNK